MLDCFFQKTNQYAKKAGIDRLLNSTLIGIGNL